MLNNYDSSAIVAVSDLARARQFYEQLLGLEVLNDRLDEGVLIFRTGGTKLIVYQSAEAGSNRANAVVWGVGNDLAAIVHELESQNVRFERYPALGELVGNVHKVGRFGLVWFKDPDGNILHLNNM